MKNKIRLAVGALLARYGYSLVRTNIAGTTWNDVLSTAIAETPGSPPPLVLDIGANTGGFSEMVIQANPLAEVHAFEPIPAVHAQLLALSARYPGLHAHNLALGESAGTVDFRVHSHSESSSLLAMTKDYSGLYPESSRVDSTVSVKLDTLDGWAGGSGIESGRLVDLIKMDVQGYEDRVIRGGRETLQRARYLVVEAAFYPSYEGGVMLDELCGLLLSAGFRLVWAFNVFAGSADLFWKKSPPEAGGAGRL
jgi:FkbM family methyltransferase